MKKIVHLLFFVTLLLAGCNQQPVQKSLLNQLLQYENSYVGDASAVSNILSLLPGNEFLVGGISLQTTTEPYKINVNYIKTVKNDADYEAFWIEENIRKVFLNNATMLFGLIQNVGVIQFDVYDHTYTFTREGVTQFYEENLTEVVKKANPVLDDNYYFNKKYLDFYQD